MLRQGVISPLKMADRLLAALYAREPPAKVVAAVTGGGTSAAELLFRPGSSSTMLHFAVPYSRSSLLEFLHDPAASTLPIDKYCSAEMAERMAVAAWRRSLELEKQESDANDGAASKALSAALQRYRGAVGVGCTAALATNYPKKGPHECFLSVCRATRHADLIAPQCETYHVSLDKTLGRSRSEEDRIVSSWLVYALTRSAEVDEDGCAAFRAALEAEQTGSDSVREVVDGANAAVSDPLVDLCSSSDPACICFLPTQTNGTEGAGVTVARGFRFRGIVLPGSFNPLHQGHVDLALAAQRKVAQLTGVELPIGFEMAVANADKGSIESSIVLERVRQFGPDGGVGLGEWPVFVTTTSLFGQKAELLHDCVFAIGADTAVRLVDRKYYEQDELRMALALQRIADRGCSFVVAGRFDRKLQRFVSAEEVLADHIPTAFRDLFILLNEGDYRNDMSSTQLRQQAAEKDAEQHQ